MKDSLTIIILVLCVFAVVMLNQCILQNIEDQLSTIKLDKTVNINTNQVEDYYPNMTVTAYSPEIGQTDSTPYTTAILEKPVQGWTVGVSPDLLKFLGDQVYIEGQGVYRVEDRMNDRFRERVDIFFSDTEMAMSFGKKNLRVVFLD